MLYLLGKVPVASVSEVSTFHLKVDHYFTVFTV